MRPLPRLLGLCLLSPSAAAQAPDELPTSQWIWGTAEVRDGQSCWFRRAFQVDEPVRRAQLLIACDNRFVAYLDGERLGEGSEWWRLQRIDLTARLQRGRHLLAIRGDNEGGPAGLLLRLDLQLASGAWQRLVSDSRWRASLTEVPGWQTLELDDGAWPAARSYGTSARPDGPWPDPLPQRAVTEATAIDLPAGFGAERLGAANPWEGSWINLAFDASGRLLVAVENGDLLRLTLPPAQGGEVHVEELDTGVRNVHGILCLGDALYLNSNAAIEQGGGLHRLRDVDRDGHFESRQRLLAWGPGGEHGAHGVVLGPDGWLWVVQGNMVSLPEPLSSSSPHRNFAEDVLEPRLQDPRGHANGVTAPGAHVLRIDPQSLRCELWCGGLRNPFDLAFDDRGELFTCDADMEWDLGLPWYRPVRVVHLVSGGEYGWRAGSAKWPAQWLDGLPAAVDIGLGSPTGVCFGTGSGFPQRYRRALFVGDWAHGRILAVHLQPSGASQVGSFEVFAAAKPLNVTDLCIGPDGCLYFLTGGRGTASALYRIRWHGRGEDAAPTNAAVPTAVQQRRRLEALHGRVGESAGASSVASAWPWLDADDRFLRHAARIAIEAQPVAAWAARALAEDGANARWQALLALARVGGPERQTAVVERCLEPAAFAAAPAQAARVLAVAWARHRDHVEGLREQIVAALTQRFPLHDATADLLLASLSCGLHADDLPSRLVGRLDADITPTERIAYACVLRSVRKGWTDALRDRYLEHLLAFDGANGGESYAGYLRAIENDYLQGLEPRARTVSQARLQAERARRATAAAPPAPNSAPSAAVVAWNLDQLLAELHRVGSGRSIARGEAAYRAAQCHLCHRLGGAGGDRGPDLTAVASRFGRRDLVEAILLPSKAIPDAYAHVEITTRDHGRYVGRVLEENAERILLDVGPFDEQRVTLRPADVVERARSRVSPMPEGLLSGLSLEQVLDLLAFLEGGDKR